MPCFRQSSWPPRPALSILGHDDDLFLHVPFSNHGPLLQAPSQHSRTSWPLIYGSEGRSLRQRSPFV